jgi:hypothetical protein
MIPFFADPLIEILTEYTYDIFSNIQIIKKTVKVLLLYETKIVFIKNFALFQNIFNSIRIKNNEKTISKHSTIL